MDPVVIGRPETVRAGINRSGGAVAFCELYARPLLAPADRLTGAASFPCIPCFGRVYGGALDFDGRRYALGPTATEIDPRAPIHGEGWVRDWRVIDHGAERLDLALGYAPAEPGRWPFAFRAEQSFAVSATGFENILTLTNVHDGPAPAGLALHPYFPRSAATRLAFHAARLWAPPGDDEGESGAFHPLDRQGLGGGAPAPLPLEGLDHTFSGFGGAVLIEGGETTLRLKSNAPHLHVYAPAGADFFCLEPVTHLPGRLTGGAANDGYGAILAPGEGVSLGMTIEAAA